MKKLALLLLGLGVAGAATWAVLDARRKARAASCAERLRQLWVLQVTEVIGRGGRRGFSKLTGPDFWLRLTRTSPPMVEPSHEDVFRCPTRPPSSDRRLDYRGPARPVGDLAESDVVGACLADHGGGGITVLLKNGEALSVHPGDPLYAKALTATR